ncbi:MAG: DMT family transporter [Parvibaculales bacterium]
MSENLKGAFVTSLTVFTFALNDALMKSILLDVPLYQAIFLRGLLVMPILGVLTWRFGQVVPNLAASDRTIILQRSLLEALLTFLFVTALAKLPLAVVVVIMQSAPLALTACAAVFLKEHVGWRRWVATIIGFFGILIIVQPGTDGFDANIFFAIAAVVCLVVRDMLTRKMSPEVPPLFAVMWTAIATVVMAALFIPFTPWVALDASSYGLLFMACFTIISAYLLSILMMRIGEIGFVSQFRYTGILWAVLLGVFLFDEYPDAATLFGATLIIATGIYSISRERLKAGVTGQAGGD